MRTSLRIATLAMATACAAGPSPVPPDGATGAAPGRRAPTTLTWQTYDSVKALVALRPKETTYERVPWKRTALEGFMEAQTQDKPLLLWLYFGGPRGAC